MRWWSAAGCEWWWKKTEGPAAPKVGRSCRAVRLKTALAPPKVDPQTMTGTILWTSRLRRSERHPGSLPPLELCGPPVGPLGSVPTNWASLREARRGWTGTASLRWKPLGLIEML